LRWCFRPGLLVPRIVVQIGLDDDRPRHSALRSPARENAGGLCGHLTHVTYSRRWLDDTSLVPTGIACETEQWCRVIFDLLVRQCGFGMDFSLTATADQPIVLVVNLGSQEPVGRRPLNVPSRHVPKPATTCATSSRARPDPGDNGAAGGIQHALPGRRGVRLSSRTLSGTFLSRYLARLIR
jgi:hypothetical protein